VLSVDRNPLAVVVFMSREWLMLVTVVRFCSVSQSLATMVDNNIKIQKNSELQTLLVQLLKMMAGLRTPNALAARWNSCLQVALYIEMSTRQDGS
jgi:hypothetical protein